MLVFLSSIPVAIFYKWQIALILLIASRIIKGAVKKSAVEFVVQYAVLSKEFYEAFMERELILFKTLK